MAAARRGHSARLLRLGGATAIACLLSVGIGPAPLGAQGIGGTDGAAISPNAQMLLEADTLTFDNDADTVSAIGGVRIDYDGNKLVADKVTYDRKTSRLLAVGNVEIVDRDGTKFSSEQIDVTDDFGEGFINALRVETADKTYFGAESALRQGGNVTTFNNGVYTACAPCEDKPGKAPIWRVKSQTIVWNQQKKTIRFRNARFELFGLPIAYFPFLEIPDQTVKRKTGFLFPGVNYNQELGLGVTVPFYLALSPTYDLTLQGTGFTNQGFLGEAEWRQRFNTGAYSIKIAGIRQNNPDAFDLNTVDRGYPADPNKTRLLFATKGDFKINPRWTFGWDVLVQSDKNFAFTYGIDGYGDFVNQSKVFLTGLNDRNFFDLRAIKFQLQEERPDFTAAGLRSRFAREPLQPWALPSFDYSYTPDEPIAGGELNIDINSRVLYRDELDFPGPVRGIDGTNSRVTAEAEWKKSFLTPGGLMVTPLLHAQTDASYVDTSPLSLAAIDALALNRSVTADIRSAYYRYMASAGLEARWPVLFSTTSASHVLEPIAQIFVRPDAQHADSLGIPNEDAQSLVFDASSLFERDKFSGYDRIEGGTRANIGFRYSGSYANGFATNAIFGQSFHIAGVNPYTSPDLVDAGAFSGLESDRSDYVGYVGLSTPNGLTVSGGARLDEESFELRRGEIRARYITPRYTVLSQYTFIDGQPLYGFPNNRHEVSLGGSLKFHENWTAFARGTYDLESKLVTSDSYGLTYGDECFVFGVTVAQTRNVITREVDRSFGFTLSLRTIGDFGVSTASLVDQ